MRYDAPLSLGIGQIDSYEAILLGLMVPIAASLLVGLNRETSVIIGVLSALAMVSFR
ncbi:MAG: hypothetical protein AAGI70_15000 [Pseudomonadota bacterium]